jgi:CubicO group peptidase (beta-lactamase class C family)
MGAEVLANGPSLPRRTAAIGQGVPPNYVGSAAGVHQSADDLLHRTKSAGSGQLRTSIETLRAEKKCSDFLLGDRQRTWGNFKLAHRRRVPLGEFCWVGAFGTAFWVDPKERLIAVLMAQLAPTQTRHYRSPRQWCVHRACQALPHNRSRCSASGARASIR